MKRIHLALLLLCLAGNGFAQKGFGIDGTIGIGRNGGDLVYPLLLEGRMQFNDYFSMNLGLGLWNSGFKGNWKHDKTATSTLYGLTSNKTLPSVQLSTRAQMPLFKYNDKHIRLFVEPKLYFLPFSAQSVVLKETYFKIKTDAGTGNIIYTPTGEVKSSSMKSECHPRFYGGVQAGLAYEVIENVDIAISYGYTNMDLFKDLRGRSSTDFSSTAWPLDQYLPRKGLQQINISFLVNFNLN